MKPQIYVAAREHFVNDQVLDRGIYHVEKRH
jgi:hypothetical protein